MSGVDRRSRSSWGDRLVPPLFGRDPVASREGRRETRDGAAETGKPARVASRIGRGTVASREGARAESTEGRGASGGTGWFPRSSSRRGKGRERSRPKVAQRAGKPAGFPGQP